MEGFNNLFEILVEHVTKNKRHADFDHTVNLAKEYRMMVTGEGIESMIQQFNSREDDEQFKQRKKLTIIVVQSITNKIMMPERKVASAQPIIKEFFYLNDEGKDKYNRLKEIIDSFYNNRGVDKYLEDTLFDLYSVDPNAFMLFLFNDYDNRIERPVVYGIPIYSDEVLNFEYVNNELDWLIFRKAIRYKEKEKDKEGFYYSIIAQNEQVAMTQIAKEEAGIVSMQNEVLYSEDGAVDIEDVIPTQQYFLKLGNNYFSVVFTEPKAGFTPAFRIGNIPDLRTNGRTMINNWHNALPYLRKAVKTCSELDITESLHVFAQTFEYLPRCNGQSIEGNYIPCNNGQTPDGKMCGACNGTGYQTNKSGQDKITLSLPRDPKDIFDLRQLKAYISAPIDILDRLTEQMERHERKAIEAVYNSNRFVVSSTIKTATESQIDYQSIYDALKRLMQQYSSAWQFVIRVNAAYNDLNNELVVRHKFGHRIGLESETDLITKIQLAKQAGVSSYVIEQLNNDLINLIYSDYPDLIMKIETKQRFFPFEGKDPSTINMLVSQGLVDKEDVILYSNFKRIFEELEVENEDFYKLVYEKQRELVKEKVRQIKEQIEKAQEVKLPFAEMISQ